MNYIRTRTGETYTSASLYFRVPNGFHCVDTTIFCISDRNLKYTINQRDCDHTSIIERMIYDHRGNPNQNSKNETMETQVKLYACHVTYHIHIPDKTTSKSYPPLYFSPLQALAFSFMQ